MSQVPSPTSQGYAAASVTQFSIFLENRVGKLSELVKGFDDHLCRIFALSVHDASDHAVVRMITNNAEEARATLREQRLPFTESQVLLISLDTGHTLTQVCHYLLSAELNIRFTYPVLGWPDRPTVLALAIDDPTLAQQILIRKGFRLLAEADLPKYGEQ